MTIELLNSRFLLAKCDSFDLKLTFNVINYIQGICLPREPLNDSITISILLIMLYLTYKLWKSQSKISMCYPIKACKYFQVHWMPQEWFGEDSGFRCRCEAMAGGKTKSQQIVLLWQLVQVGYQLLKVATGTAWQGASQLQVLLG